MNNDIREHIEKYFSLSSKLGAYNINTPDVRFPAWVFRQDQEYGVLIPYEGEDISECFAGTRLYSRQVSIEHVGERKALALSCMNRDLRKQFALICEDFVNPGDNGEKRSSLLSDPLFWWKQWSELLGNVERERMVFDIVGELWAVLKLYQMGKEPCWSAAKIGTHDIELENESYEVKSTMKKSASQIHINSQFQLESMKPLYLVFTRLEESLSGYSIDNLLKLISKYDEDHLAAYNRYLESCGYGLGNHLRKRKYVLLERKLYFIDDNFPRITHTSFKGDSVPEGITHIEYDVSLDGLASINWE